MKSIRINKLCRMGYDTVLKYVVEHICLKVLDAPGLANRI